MQFSVFEILLTVFFSVFLSLALLKLIKYFFPDQINQFLENKRCGGLFILFPLIFFISLTQAQNSGFLLTKDFISIIFGLLLILVFGLRDDLRGSSWRFQAFIQSVLAIILVLAGDSIQHIRLPSGEIFFLTAIAGAVLTYFWVIVVINSLNWLDGADGLATTVSLIAFATLGFLSLTGKVNQPSTAAICFALVFLLTLFLAFNLPPARLYLGTVGVWTLGFLIATVSLYSGGKVATTALVLSIPIVDFILVFLERIFKGKFPVLGGDRLHLHQRLILLGWPHWKVTVFLGVVTLILGLATLIFQTANKVFLLFPIALFFFALALILLKNQKPTKRK